MEITFTPSERTAVLPHFPKNACWGGCVDILLPGHIHAHKAIAASPGPPIAIIANTRYSGME